MHKTTFEALWRQHLEPRARNLGVVDGDLARVRSSVKSTLVSAGWASPQGDVSFVTKEDGGNCMSAAAEVVARVAPALAAERQVSRSQVLAASRSASAHSVMATLESTNTVSASFPAMATANERCPRCQAAMQPVALVNDRAAVYCPRDRVVLPLSGAGRTA